MGQVLRQEVEAVDPSEIEVLEIRTTEQIVAELGADSRFRAQLVILFAVLATGITCLGLFGVLMGQNRVPDPPARMVTQRFGSGGVEELVDSGKEFLGAEWFGEEIVGSHAKGCFPVGVPVSDLAVDAVSDFSPGLASTVIPIAFPNPVTSMLYSAGRTTSTSKMPARRVATAMALSSLVRVGGSWSVSVVIDQPFETA